jgi:hypothetical protein
MISKMAQNPDPNPSSTTASSGSAPMHPLAQALLDSGMDLNNAAGYMESAMIDAGSMPLAVFEGFKADEHSSNEKPAQSTHALHAAIPNISEKLTAKRAKKDERQGQSAAPTRAAKPS